MAIDTVDWTKTNMSGGWGVLPQPNNKPTGYPAVYPTPLQQATKPAGISYGADQNYGMGPQSPYQLELSPQQKAVQPQIMNPNSIDMSQSIYASALQKQTTQNAASIASAPTAVANAGGGQDYLAQRTLAGKREAEADALKGKIAGAVNPYGVDTDGYRVGVNAARNRLVGEQNQAQALAAGRLGGVAGGLREATSEAMANDGRAALAAIEAQMYGAERDRATGYETNRDRALMQLANGDFSGASSIYGGLMAATLNQSNADRGYALDARQDARAETSANIQNAMAQIQLQYAPELARLGLNEAQLRQKLLEYEVSDEAWDRANPAAAFARDMAAGLIQTGVQAAGRYAGR